ncbi:MAG: Methylmalonyl-CoA mutase [Actinomycetia bacterium]|nr:Methylmalonyl-CoA mutase [Actinomycetes bacterium]
MKRGRDADAASSALARIQRDAADPGVNLMPALLAAVTAYVTVGEITAALETVFGTWAERAIA